MNDTTYSTLVDHAFRAIGDALENVDGELVDCESAGDVMTLTFADGKRCVVNTQRPTRQIWLAANARAWHFSWDDQAKRWIDDKGHGDELFATLTSIVRDGAGIDVAFE